MNEAKRRVGVLISGRGSNMAALVEAAKAPDFPAEIVLVLSDNPEAPGLAAAREAGVAARAVDRGAYADRAAFEAALSEGLREAEVDFICLAGFMRVLGPQFVRQWRGRLINIHPSLLPAYPGLDTHARALAGGEREHGCSVHFVTEGVDEGPIIAQARVPIEPEDDEAALASRVLSKEHRLYPWCLALLAKGMVRLSDDGIEFAAGLQSPEPAIAIAPGA